MRISDWSSDVCSSDLYDPIQIGHDVPKWRDYTEANGWQATFLNQHDLYGLIEHFGGDAAFEKQLDALFNGPSTLPDNAPPAISALVGQYAHGYEPDQSVASMYAHWWGTSGSAGHRVGNGWARSG